MPAPTKTWNPVKYGNVVYRSQRKLARFYLLHSKLSQTEIANRISCSAPCVNQVAQELKAEGLKRPK